MSFNLIKNLHRLSLLCMDAVWNIRFELLPPASSSSSSLSRSLDPSFCSYDSTSNFTSGCVRVRVWMWSLDIDKNRNQTQLIP